MLREIVAAVRGSWPEGAPLFIRISVTDWVDGGWDIQQSIELARQLKELGVDLIDCSSGGNVPHAKIPVGPGYQTPFAEQIRREANILTGAVGMITSPIQAEHVLVTG
jgi:2,4-dienoyl-CoA reductase-like NADH-dependent reductase (Old Yellow Enzyme family)